MRSLRPTPYRGDARPCISRSWYPETAQQRSQRWTVPSCGTCNNKLGAMEKEVFNRLALCVDPRKAEAAGLSAKAIRSMGIGVEGLNLTRPRTDGRKSLRS